MNLFSVDDPLLVGVSVYASVFTWSVFIGVFVGVGMAVGRLCLRRGEIFEGSWEHLAEGVGEKLVYQRVECQQVVVYGDSVGKSSTLVEPS